MASIRLCGYAASASVLMSGNPSAPTILALHGFTGSGQDFHHVRESLGPDAAHWICPDFMGHGSSESPGILDPYQLPASLRLIDAARRLAPDPDRVALLAYSMGGRIALHYLKRARPLPAILIGVSPGLATAAERTDRRQADQRWIALLQQPDPMETFAAEWEKQSLIEPQVRLPEPLRSRLARSRRANHPVGLAHSLMGCGTGSLPSLWDSLGSLPPLTLAHGSQDHKFAAIARDMAARNGQLRLAEVPASSHAAHLEAPHEVARLLRSLLIAAF